MGRARSIACALLAGALIGCGRTDPAPTPESTGTGGGSTNVILLSLDSVRHDLLGVYGRRPRHAPELTPSPHLDGLAREGVVFLDAYATTSWTLPSHVALFTGEPELVHGVETDGWALGDELGTLAEGLRALGFRTTGFYSGPYLEERYGFARGFERYERIYGPTLAAAWEENERARKDGADAEELAATERVLELASQGDRSSERVVDAVLSELEPASADPRPFFLFAHFFDPHYDYDPPPPFDRRFDPDYAGAFEGEDFIRNPDIAEFDANAPSGRRRVIDERDLEHLIARYEGELAWTDAQIGRILSRLAELELDESTLVVVVSDHGDEFFEHDGIGHRRTLFEEVVRVPFFMRLPGRIPAGTRVAGPVSLTDVAPTILELVGASRERADDEPRPGLWGEIERGSSDRTPLCRLVRRDGLRIGVPTTRGKVPVAGELLTVIDAFRSGPLKIVRERRWTRATEPLTGAIAEAIRRQSDELFAEEALSWIDLEKHPDDALEAYSEDFSEPRARQALEAFREEYRSRARRRFAARPLPDDPAGLALLRGLGYVDEGEAERPRALDREIPPPGEDR